ncbi:hypothetical protein CRYUN_Cryun04dG0181600 [Craigia yunnanensis]
MMVYKTVQAQHFVQKVVHLILQLAAFVLGVIGICAVFKFHDMTNVEDVYSFHSWIGIATISLFAFQLKLFYFDSKLGGAVVSRAGHIDVSTNRHDKENTASLAHLWWQDIAIHVDSCSSHWLDGEGYLHGHAT